jgi:hypothetical protein
MFTASTSGTTDYGRGKESHTRLDEEFALPTDEIVPYQARAAVTISAETAESLIYFVAEQMEDKPSALRLGFDLRRQDPEKLGFDLFSTAVAAFGQTPEEFSGTETPVDGPARTAADCGRISRAPHFGCPAMEGKAMGLVRPTAPA